MAPKKQSFEHFYRTKVALGDCCGCAERVIDWRDIELAAMNSRRQTLPAKKSRWSHFRDRLMSLTRGLKATRNLKPTGHLNQEKK